MSLKQSSLPESTTPPIQPGRPKIHVKVHRKVQGSLRKQHTLHLTHQRAGPDVARALAGRVGLRASVVDYARRGHFLRPILGASRSALDSSFARRRVSDRRSRFVRLFRDRFRDERIDLAEHRVQIGFPAELQLLDGRFESFVPGDSRKRPAQADRVDPFCEKTAVNVEALAAPFRTE